MNYNDAEAIAFIYDRIWQLSPDYKNTTSYNTLNELTKTLIDIYKENNRIDSDPFLMTADRTLSLPIDQLNELLTNQICLVTGGLGCVGSTLVKKLLTFNVKSIIIFDKQPIADHSFIDSRVIFVNGNICEEESLQNCFDNFSPNLVFHTAAQRNPGYAEKHIVEVIKENVFGTLNIVNVCERTTSVKQCVFSSTGKSSRYYTSEIYAATKKLCEFIFDATAKNSRVLYSMVRFTHILNNSLMNIELSNVADVDHLAIHSPGKYVTAQNVSEAASLMLNALVYAKKDKSVFLIVKNLGWPVESLEVALYSILEHKKDIPVIFNGNPPGYKEGFFRGQLDWAKPQDLNLLINVYENQEIRVNEADDIIIAKIMPINKEKLFNSLAAFENIDDEIKAKSWLLDTLYESVGESLKFVKESDTVNILKWGLDANYLNSEGNLNDNFKEIVELLTNSLVGSEYYQEAKKLTDKFQHAPNVY